MRSAGGSRILAWFLLAVVAVAGPAAADDRIPDPQKWCGDFMEIVARGVNDDIVSMAAHASGGRITEAAAATAFAQIGPAIKQAGAHISTEPMSEKRYGTVAAQFWYMLAFQHAVLFTRCDMAHVSGTWISTGFWANTDMGKVGLP
jgi:hypothetical protein